MNLNCELDKLLPFMPYPSGKLFGAPPVCSLSLQHIMNIPNSVAWTCKTSWILLNTKLDSSDIIQAAWSKHGKSKLDSLKQLAVWYGDM